MKPIKAHQKLEEISTTKIYAAIEKLMDENKVLNQSSVAKQAGISRNTAKKYLVKLGFIETDRALQLKRLSNDLKLLLTKKNIAQKDEIKEAFKWFLFMQDLIKTHPEFKPKNWEQQCSDWENFFKPCFGVTS